MSEATPPTQPEDPQAGQGSPPPYPQSGQGSPPPHPQAPYSQPPGPAQPGGYPAAPPPPGYAAGPQPATLLDRFVARLIDGILIAIVNVIITIVLIAGLFGLDGANAFGTGGSYVASIISAVIGVAINLGYFAFMDSSQGQTLGKMVVKLHVRGASGGKPSVEESLKRNWWLALPLLAIVPLVGGLVGSLAELAVIIVIAVQINSTPDRRPSLTDRLAGTQVVKQG